MAQEIERKFLLATQKWQDMPLKSQYEIAQGYIDPKIASVFFDFSQNRHFSMVLVPKQADFNDKTAKGAVTLSAHYNEISEFQGFDALPQFNAKTGELLLQDGVICRLRYRENVQNGEKQAFVTIKASTDDPEIVSEFEAMIDPNQVAPILKQFGAYNIYKTRHVVPYQGADWEIDVFKGALQGLIMAEIEVETQAQFTTLTLLPGLGEDVTADMRYRNRALGEYGLPS